MYMCNYKHYQFFLGVIVSIVLITHQTQSYTRVSFVIETQNTPSLADSGVPVRGWWRRPRLGGGRHVKTRELVRGGGQ